MPAGEHSFSVLNLPVIPILVTSRWACHKNRNGVTVMAQKLNGPAASAFLRDFEPVAFNANETPYPD